MKQTKLKPLKYFLVLWFVFFLLFYLWPSKHLGPDRSRESVLFEGIISQKLLFVESPELDLTPFEEKEFAMLPALYHSLPSNIPLEVRIFLEKRNQLIYQFSKTFLSENVSNVFKAPFDVYEEIVEIIPARIHGLEVVVVVSPEILIFDQNLSPLNFNSYAPFGEDYQLDGLVLSARFSERFWMQYSSSGPQGTRAYLRKLTLDETILFDNELLIVDTVQNSIPVLSLQVSHAQTDPEVQVFQTSPWDILSFSGVLSMWVIIMWWLIQWSQRFVFRINSKIPDASKPRR